MKLTCLFFLFFTLIASIFSAVNFSPFTGLTLNGQGGKKVDCSDITATTTKLDLSTSGMGFSCVSTDLVDGVEFSNYKTKGCSDAPATLAVKSDDCMVDGAWGAVSRKFMCNKEKTQVTISSYTGALCQEPVKNAYVFKSNDGICHATDTVQPKPKASPSPAPKAKAAPAPSPSGDASTNALATGFAVAGLIVSLVLM